MSSALAVIGFDGSDAAQAAIREAAGILAPRRALVVVVWEAGRAFETATLPVLGFAMPVVSLDIRSAFELDKARYEAAERLAQQGAALAQDAGFEAEGLAVADDITVGDSLVRIAQEQVAAAIVVGTHGHSGLHDLVLGSTSRRVVSRAPCPVVLGGIFQPEPE
jgi:nucleotide-binding universal stress UspA family protein